MSLTTNPFFNLYNNRQEQWLVEDLIHEAVQILGFTCHYVPNVNEISRDLLFSDDPLKKFEKAYPLEVYLVNSTDPGMSGDFFSKFGLEVKNSIRIQLPRRAFTKRVPQQRPKEGDLIYVPFLSGNGELYEIKFVDDTGDFFTLGRKNPYYWILELELFKYSHEIINTGNEEIDIVNQLDAFSINFNMASGNGNYILQETAYQGNTLNISTASGQVVEWDRDNNILRLANIIGEFSNTAIIIGATSNAQYQLANFDMLDEPQFENPYDNRVVKNEIDPYIDTSEINPLGML